MFNSIQKLTKGLADEFEHAIKNVGDTSSANQRQQRQPTNAADSTSSGQPSKGVSKAFDTLKANAGILSTQTPDPDSLDIHSSPRPETPSKELSPQPSSHPTETTDSNQSTTNSSTQEHGDTSDSNHPDSEPNKDAQAAPPNPVNTVEYDGFIVPREIVPKLRKFKKYEAKYPGMFYFYFL